MINWHTLTLRSIFQIPLKELIWPQISWSHVFWITNGDTLSQSHEISWRLYWEYLLGIYDHFMVSPIGQSLLLILVQTQYLLKVANPYNIVTWWIMIFDSLASWFTVGPVQYAWHTLVHSPWKTDPDSQDKSSLQFGGSTPQSLLDYLNLLTDCGQFIY